ncbi:MAG TPA: hypothetical protein VGM44_14895 [Polyangiaceae bacterium]
MIQAELGNSITVWSEPLRDAPGAPTQNSNAEVARVTVRCAETAIEVEVLDPVTGKKLSRHLQIPPDLAAARTRVLGISIAELVAASWIELSGTSESPARVVERTAPKETRTAALSAAERGLSTGARGRGYELQSFAFGERFTAQDFDSAGVGVAFGWIARSFLDLTFDARGDAGSRAVSLGRVNTLLGSLAFCPRARLALGLWALEAGVGVRVGLVHFGGVARSDLTPAPESRSPTLPWAGPLLAFAASVRPVRPLVFSARLEAGLVSYRAEARVAGASEFAIAGPWLGLGLGFGFSGVD